MTIAIVFVGGLGWTLADGASRFDRNTRRVVEPPTPPDNGYYTVIYGGEVLVPDGGWATFTWEESHDGAILFDNQGPFEFESQTPVTLRVTDDFSAGDEFRVYDNGVEVGKTFWVGPVQRNGGLGPDVAFGTAWMASGIYQLPAGRHSIRIEVTENAWERGRGYLRVDSETPLATVDLQDVSNTYGAVHGEDRFHFMVTVTPGADSDGLFPGALEEIVVWYGKYLEVLRPDQFTPIGSQWVYENPDGSGITRAVIGQDGTVMFEGRSVDLCPGINPHKIGLWLGNEGGSVGVRCSGTLSNVDP